MATNWNDASHPLVQQLAQSTPAQVSQADAQKAVQDLHDQIPADQLKPVLDQHYSNMDPAQLQAIVAQLQQQLAQQAKPESQQLAASVDPATATPQQAAELHAHAHEHHPQIVRDVVIGGAGVAAVGGLAVLAARHFKNQANS